MSSTKQLSVFSAVTIFIMSFSGVGFAQANDGAPEKEPGYIVKFKAPNGMVRTSAVAAARAVAESLGAEALSPSAGIYKVADASKLPTDGSVEYVERDQVVTAFFGKSKPKNETKLNSKAWGAIRVGTEELMKKNITGEGITVAVIDTGVQADHPALKGKVLTGYDFYNNDNNADDDNGHGTHCAGIIAGDGIGIAQGVKILPLKFLNKDGSGMISDAIRAVEFAKEKRVQVMSNSWGSYGAASYSKALEDAIISASNAGIVSIAAAGNSFENNDVVPSYPANNETVISVAATESDEFIAPYSCYGKQTVHVAAPGSQIYSSIPGGQYGYKSGTSMATPAVAAIAALVLSQRSVTPAAMKSCLIAAKDPKLTVVLPVAGIARISAVRALEVCR